MQCQNRCEIKKKFRSQLERKRKKKIGSRYKSSAKKLPHKQVKTLLVRLGGYMVNSLDCYSYRLIGKLTSFLKLQEFSRFLNMTVDSSTSSAPRSLRHYNESRQDPREDCCFPC